MSWYQNGPFVLARTRNNASRLGRIDGSERKIGRVGTWSDGINDEGDTSVSEEMVLHVVIGVSSMSSHQKGRCSNGSTGNGLLVTIWMASGRYASIKEKVLQEGG
jgi:hypothetical protein